MKKAIKRTMIVFGSIIGGLVALFLLIYLIFAIIGAASYGEARKAREYVCPIPELGSGYAPQGVSYSSDRNVYFITGYDKNDTTILYVVTGKKEYRRVRLADEDGNELKGHAGGITCTKNNVYIANDNSLVMFNLDELLNTGANDSAKVVKSFPVDNTAAFCYSNDEYMFVGEFYREQNYKTAESHHYTTPNGDANKAIVSCYKLDENGLLASGDEQPYPLYCISITDLVQGFATDGETFIMSRSYGLKNSTLDYHSAPKDSGKTIDVTFKNNTKAESRAVPLYYLDSTTNYKTLSLPAFSEDITIVNDKVIVTNEASANKYVVGKLFGSNKVYAYPIYKNE